MARKNRVTVIDGIYHVCSRIANQAMYLKPDEVKDKIFAWMLDIAHFSGVDVYAWCIMDNHLHLLVHVPRVPKRFWNDPSIEPDAWAFGMRPPECRDRLWYPDGDSPQPRPLPRPETGFMLDDEEMLARLASLYSPKTAENIGKRWGKLRSIGCGACVDEEKDGYCRRMYNLSQFLKTLKERIAMRYNREYKHSGCLWQGRFYSGAGFW